MTNEEIIHKDEGRPLKKQAVLINQLSLILAMTALFTRRARKCLVTTKTRIARLV